MKPSQQKNQNDVLESTETNTATPSQGVEKENQKVFSAQFMHELSGEYTEMYKVLSPSGKIMYWGRDNYPRAPKHWNSICDAPDGYCEKDYMINSEVKINICDEKGSVLFETYNGDPQYIPTFEDQVKEVMSALPNVTEVLTQSRKDYLQPFYDAIILQGNMDRFNFFDFHSERTDRKKLFSFTWMGRTYDLCIETHNHNLCNAHWKEVVILDRKNECCQKHIGYIIPPFPGESLELLPEHITLQMIARTEIIGCGAACCAKRIIAAGQARQFNDFRKNGEYANRSLKDLRRTLLDFNEKL